MNANCNKNQIKKNIVSRDDSCKSLDWGKKREEKHMYNKKLETKAGSASSITSGLILLNVKVSPSLR